MAVKDRPLDVIQTAPETDQRVGGVGGGSNARKRHQAHGNANQSIWSGMRDWVPALQAGQIDFGEEKMVAGDRYLMLSI